MTARAVYDPVTTMRMFKYLRETTPNHGARIEAVQHWALGSYGDSYCDEAAVGFVLDIVFQGESPFPRTTEMNASTPTTLAYARAQGWETTSPVPGDLVFFLRPDGTPHHVAMITELAPLTACAGNTSPDGTSPDGTGWYEHEITPDAKAYVHYPRG